MCRASTRSPPPGSSSAARSQAKTRASSEQRRKLDNLLAELDDSLVIIIDDIDRLRDEEVADVMRLVRAVADFPNTVYILAFDVERVARAVSNDYDDRHTYIEKIVQVSHEVPATSIEQLSDLLLKRLERSLNGITYRLTQEHWWTRYFRFRRYFANPARHRALLQSRPGADDLARRRDRSRRHPGAGGAPAL